MYGNLHMYKCWEEIYRSCRIWNLDQFTSKLSPWEFFHWWKPKPVGIFKTIKKFAFCISEDVLVCFYRSQDEDTSDSWHPPDQNLWSPLAGLFQGEEVKWRSSPTSFTSRFSYLNQKYLPYVRFRRGVCQLMIWLDKVQLLHSRVLKFHWLFLEY